MKAIQESSRRILFFFAVCGLGVLGARNAAAQTASHANTTTGKKSPSAQQAIQMAENGRCREAISVLHKTLEASPDLAMKKQAGVLGLRCALAVDDRDEAEDFLRLLRKAAPNDPEILYVMVHAYSDLSTREAQDLGRLAPQSVPARELNAEALELQGKWDEAMGEYRQILKQDPQMKGIHYRIGRVLLSKPDPKPEDLQKAKEEMLEELKIDPKNAGAEYVIGELATQAQQCPEAIEHFSRAAKLDASFGDAFLGWGFCLLTTKQYDAAIAPLETAVRLQPGNPAAHYNLGMALSRAGRKEEADKEFAIHRELVQKSDARKVKNE